MNYAEDRLDRRATAKGDTTTHDQLEYDLKRAHCVFRNCASSHKHECDLPVPPPPPADEAAPSISPSLHDIRAAHELAGKTLRDCGQNRQAVFHFGMAWRICHWLEKLGQNNESNTGANIDDYSIEKDEWESIGDYAQMCEFSGFPEIGVFALLFYREGGCIEFDYTTPVCLPFDNTASEPNGIQHHGCGCNMAECGRSPCFVAFPYRSTVIDDILSSLDALSVEVDNEFPCALDVLAHLAYMSRKADIISNTTEAMHDFLCKQQSIKNIPSALRFWDNGSLEQSQHCRKLPPLILLLLLKLLYSSPMSGSFLQLACISLPYLAGRFPLDSSEGRILAQRYKSHWAYYVFIRALVLGERVKKHKKDRVAGQIPVWDIVFCAESETLNRTKVREAKQLDKLEYYRRIIDVCSADAMGPATDQVTTLPCWVEQKMSSVSAHVPIFVVGDSHVLSLAWQTIDIGSNAPENSDRPNIQKIVRIAVPFPATGLKAYHVRPSTRFFTHFNLQACLKRLSLSGNHRTIILSAGEIDCREGIGGSLLQGYYRNCSDAVTRTVAEYLTSLSDLALKFQLQILVMPVSPHAYRSDKNGKSTGRARRRETTHLWNESLRQELNSRRMYATPQPANTRRKYEGLFLLDYEQQLHHSDNNSPVGYVLHPCFNADYTHVNSAIVPLIEEAILNCGCDLNAL